jgi:poly(A) polymerase Pap1
MSAWQVVVYNPLVHVRSSPVRLPISTPAYTVYFGTLYKYII